MRTLPRAAAIVAAAMAIFGHALAQDYPTRTVTLVVPYPPGGGVDAMARVVAEKLAGALGQQVVVDNRAGGSGLVGTRAFIKSPPDGYTLFLGHTGSISINPSLYANAGFDPRKDFAPIGLIASMPVALLAHPSFPAKTIADVVAIAKTAGAKFNIGTSAVGTGGYRESGLPGFESVLHYGLLAPAGTPRPIIERLNAALRALAESAEVKQRIVAEGGDPLTSTPEDYAKDIDSEETKWGTLVRKLNLKVE